MAVCEVSIVVPRLDSKPWGGRKLAQYGLDLPADVRIGEALVTADDSRIDAGYGEGRTLGEVVAEDPQNRLGAIAHAAVGGRSTFPLLVKLIDANTNLSIQVHPDDSLAAPLNKLGKTEAWYILGVEHGGNLYLGLRNDVDQDAFMQHAALLDGTSSADLRRLDPRPGQTWMIPAGTVHALGAGVMVYEVQQPSDVTWRLDDWGRTDAHGNPRAMHLEEGSIAIRPELRPREIPAVRLDVAGRRQLLTACKYFALERLWFRPESTMDIGQPGTPNVLTVLEGSLRVGDLELAAGMSAVIWPGDTAVACRADANAIVLRAWVPDLMQDIAAPVRAAGGLDSDIAALGGMTHHFEDLLS